MHRAASVPIGAVVIALAVLGIARAQPAGNEGAPPRITLCDISPNLINIIRACEEAIHDYPDVARFHEHLGRALAALRSYDEARRSFEKAAELGSADGMSGLGGLYEDGRGVPKDFAEAKKWYEKAAALDDRYAALRLGVIYEKGLLGLEKSPADAVRWYRKAALQGSLEAERALSRLSPRDGLPPER
jgi:TPR repeat protein